MLRDQGFGPALEALAEQIGTSNGIRIDLDVDDAERVGETAQVALYTIIRELARPGDPARAAHADRGGDERDRRRRRSRR